MATSQQVRQKQSTGSWEMVFPAEQETVLQSELFVKKLVAVGISSITYLRTLFPENSYSELYLDGLKLKILKDNSNCRTSNMVVSWLKGCFEAIGMKCLRQLTFAILDQKNPDVTYETYTYKFQYTKEGTIIRGLGTPSCTAMINDIKKSTERMLRTLLLLTQTLKPLPRKICLSMKLGYYDEVTPANYEPPNFNECSEGAFSFYSEPITIKVGNVATKFHTVKLRVSVDKKIYSADENSADELQAEEGTQDKIVPSQAESSLGQDDALVRSFRSHSPNRTPSGATLGTPGTHECEGRSLMSSQNSDQLVPTQTLKSSFESNTETSQCTNWSVPLPATQKKALYEKAENYVPVSSSVETIYPVRCPCEVHHDHGVMVMCEICHNWQHAVCFNILEATEAPVPHVCEQCVTPEMPCTDPSLLDQPEIMMYCLYRRVLVLLHKNRQRVTAASLAQQLGVDISMGLRLLKQLQNEKILTRRKRINYVNRARLMAEAFPKYLNRSFELKRENNNVTKNSKTPLDVKHEATFSTTVTPGVDMPSQEESITALKEKDDIEPLNMSQDEQVDILNVSQDVTVGTQNILLASGIGFEGETPSDTFATAGDTLITQDSQSASQRCSATSMNFGRYDLQDSEGQSQKSQNNEIQNMKAPRGQHQKRRTLLSRGTRLSRNTSGAEQETNMALSVNDFEISMSQESEAQEKISISQESEVQGKKRKISQDE